MKIDVLGVEYEILTMSEDKFPKLKTLNANGLAELYDKKLIINERSCKPTEETYDNLEAYARKVIRHEIVHAFFHESGLMDYSNDEMLVDWMALQLPKVLKAFKEADCL